jgi:hypothetical protein
VGNVIADKRRFSRQTATPSHPTPLGDSSEYNSKSLRSSNEISNLLFRPDWSKHHKSILERARR